MHNGDHFTKNLWSDGLTMNSAPGASVSGTLFLDNSDVNFIIGGGPNAQVTGNRVVLRQNQAFAGMMMDNFNGATSGDFTGAVVSSNSIECNGRCHYGLEVGPHPWYQSANIFGGSVVGNTVGGAGICINADGAGTVAAPVVVHGNTVSGFVAGMQFLCGKICPGSLFNVAPDSVVDRQGDTNPPATSFAWNDCP
jgi:hypothetical protein